MAYPPTIPPNNRTNDTDMVNVHAADHNLIADALTAMVATPWVALPLTSPWVAYGANYQAPQYRLVGDVVQLRGVANKGSAMVVNEVLATLPAGYRPPAKFQFLALHGAAVMVNLEVQTDGRIQIVGFISAGTYLVLDGTKGWSVTA